MNEIVNKFLLAGDKFMPEMHLKQSISLGKSGFTNSACGPFTKKEEIIKKFKDTGDTKYIYKNELDKACLQHDMPYGDFKDLARRTASDKILGDNAFNTAKNPKCDGYACKVLFLWFINFLIKGQQVVGLNIKLHKISN